MRKEIRLQHSIYIIFLLLSLTFSCSNYENEIAQGSSVEIPYKNGQLTISAITQDIINFRYSDSLTYSDRDYAPILTSSVNLQVEKQEENLILSTENVELFVQLKPFSISIRDTNSTEKVQLISPYGRNGDTTSIQFKLKENEAIYGTGARALPLNRRGYKLDMFNKAHYAYQMGSELLNYCIPHITSSEKYMLLFDNPAKGWMDIGKTVDDELNFSTLGGNMSYYFINGSSYNDMITKYTELTGRQQLPPVWTFGNLQSRFGYRNQKEASSMLNKSLEAGYPVDAMILDIYWFGPELQDGQMGKLDWDAEKWPDPKQMIAEFEENNVKIITVSEPFFTLKSGRFEELESKGLLAKDSTGNAMQIPYFYFGKTGLLDIFNDDAQQWIWNQYKRMDEYGIDGWWVDLGEPEVHPDDIIHVNGLGKEVHGAYGHEWAKMLYEGYARDYPNERLFHMGRAGFAGTQRYSLIPWSGDVSRTWSGLSAQIPIMTGIGMSGIGYMHADAGGFSFVEKADPELYTRWLQFAVFTPVLRPHADEVVPPEPVTWPQEVQENVKPAIELRYKMLPYNYTLAWKNMTSGIPMARPMFMEYESIPDTLISEYMWGENLLVSPVLQPGEVIHKTYLPEGDWYDLHLNSQRKGNQWVGKTLANDHIPVYVKGGSVIVTAPAMKNTAEFTSENLNFTYYYSENSSENVVYFDDGKTKGAYKKGEYHLIKTNVQPNQTGLSIALNVEGSGYVNSPENRNIKFSLIGVPVPDNIMIDGKEAVFSMSDNAILFNLSLNKNSTIVVNYK
ncbi:glycoside hydrolase family 31 protein [Fulvivirga lutea]|uniref:DUF4968 domain-containing protein n=1 Tax=Fulvivirga lutea TaxID=2810512 RepID=A0A974WFU3_9BACT|nr:TIM-barrel domain-containing protein [Fulvivirga lutea]QSE96994.1 DUF4968 domain-containing protein [Fulvivirga lutea]